MGFAEEESSSLTDPILLCNTLYVLPSVAVVQYGFSYSVQHVLVYTARRGTAEQTQSAAPAAVYHTQLSIPASSCHIDERKNEYG
jgi:hypothetical protein